MVRSTMFQPHARQTPDPIRIVAISASIALNVAVLALLMRPPEFTLPTARDDAPPITIIVPEKPLKPIEAPILKTHPTLTTHPLTPVTHPQPQPVVSRDSTPVSIVADPVQPIGPTEPVIPITAQPVEASLTPIASPAPMYPRDALRDGISGTVELELLVGVDGRVLDVHVTRSSGNRSLDKAARDAVLRNWRFQPALRAGMPVQALGRVPIVFTLDGH